MANKRGKAAGRTYARLARHERNTIELMLGKGARRARAIAAELGRAPSTVSNEVAAHRFVVVPRARRGEPAPEGAEDACDLGGQPAQRKEALGVPAVVRGPSPRDGT